VKATCQPPLLLFLSLQVLSSPQADAFSGISAVELARAAVKRGWAGQAWQLLEARLEGICGLYPDVVVAVLEALYKKQQYQQVRIKVGIGGRRESILCHLSRLITKYLEVHIARKRKEQKYKL
jgi:hypothetical protein